MFRGRRGKGSFGSVKGQNAGVVKLAVLLSLAVFLVFLIFTVGVQQTKAADCDCGFCHGDNHHGDGWTGCSGCHDSPPQTGTHLVHYNSPSLNSVRYGGTTVSSTADAYKFDCGNCHPLDIAKHRDGILQVELYNPAAPSDSLKMKNPSTAAYAPGTNVVTYPSKVVGDTTIFSYSDGTCSNAYCHSGNTVTSGSVGFPLQSSPGVYIMDADCNLTYDLYTVNYSRVYKVTPAWGTNSDALHSTFSTCTECHAFPLTTSYPSVDAGVGDSHQWIDNYGWGNLHAWNMSNDTPVYCRTCHYATVTQANTFSTDINNVTKYDPVPLASHVMHVNGSPDVAFDQINNIVYNVIRPKVTLNLSGASYDPSTKTCSNIACHYGDNTLPPGGTSFYKIRYQQKVKWGAPSRPTDVDAECDVCHRVMLPKTCP